MNNLLRHPLTRYLAPFVLFLLLGSWRGDATGGEYWLRYALHMLAVGAAIAWLFKGRYKEISGAFDIQAIGVGLVVLVIWIANFHWLGGAPGHTAMQDMSDSPALPLCIAAKFFGSVLIIPVLEELVWRSFLMRYLIDSNFLSVPLGRYTHFSFWFAAITFAAMHPAWQWGAALAAGALYGGYMIRRKNLIGCILAHATTNAGLGLYVLATGQWSLWI